MSRIVAWPPWIVTSLRNNLDDLSLIVRDARGVEPEVLAWMSRMLVVRSSGYVEQTANAVCVGHVEHKSGGPVRSFARSWLERTRNPSPEALAELVGRFDISYQEDLLNLLDRDDQRLRRELSLLVDRRNKIAHGFNEGVSRDKAMALKDVALEIGDWFILRFNPL